MPRPPPHRWRCSPTRWRSAASTSAARSAAQTATLSNTGTAPLTIGTLSTGSAEFAIAGGTCAAGGSVAAAASCSINSASRPRPRARAAAAWWSRTTPAAAAAAPACRAPGVALNPVIGVSPATLGFSQTVAHDLGGADGHRQQHRQCAARDRHADDRRRAGGRVPDRQRHHLHGRRQRRRGGIVRAQAGLHARRRSARAAPACPSRTTRRRRRRRITLNGTGTASPQPAISLNAATLTFASQTLGSASALRRA